MIVSIKYGDFQHMLACNPPWDGMLFTVEGNNVKRVIIVNCSLPRALIIFELVNGPSAAGFKNQYKPSIQVEGIT